MKRIEKRIGFYLGEKMDGKVKMPTDESQRVLDTYLSPMSQEDISYAEQMEDTLTPYEHNLDVRLADEKVEALLRDDGFREGYEMIDDSKKSHVWFLLFYQIILRDIKNKKYVEQMKKDLYHI